MKILPEGSWKSSSRNSRMTDGILICELEDNNGIWINASIIPEPGIKYMNVNGKLEVEEDWIILLNVKNYF